MSGATLGSGLVCSFCSRGQHDRCTVCVCAVCFPVQRPGLRDTDREQVARALMRDRDDEGSVTNGRELAALLRLLDDAREQNDALATLAQSAVGVHAQVHMDTPEDRALHAAAVAELQRLARLLGVDV